MHKIEQPAPLEQGKLSTVSNLWDEAYGFVQEHPVAAVAGAAITGAVLFALTRGRIANAIEHTTMRAVGKLDLAPKTHLLREGDWHELLQAVPGKAVISNQGYFAPKFTVSNQAMASSRHYFWGIGETPHQALVNGFNNWAVKNGYRGYPLETLVEARLKLVKAGIVS